MKHPIRRRLMYLGFQGLRALVQRLPLEVGQALGRLAGVTAYGLLWTQRQLTMAHLRRALGESSSLSQRRAVARRVFINLGQNLMEWLRLPTLSKKEIQQLVTSEGLEHLREALSKGEGAIIVTAHFGNWELLPLYLGSLGFQGGALARRLRYAEYDSFLISLRGRYGISTLARGALKEVAKLLRANQLVGLLPDQDVDSLEGVFVNFFGHPAYTPVGPAALSLMTGAPIVPCFIVREGRRFRLMIEPPLYAPPAADRSRALATLTQAWSDVVESYIRRYPDHWTWMHRRWKTQPTTATRDTQHATSQTRDEQTRWSDLRLTRPVVGLLLLVACCLSLVAVVGGCSKPGGSAVTKLPTAASPTTSSSANQQMSELELTGYKEDGSKHWELEGTEGSIADQIATIRKPNGVIYDLERTIYITASVGQMDQTNRRVRLEHEVTIHTSDGLWLTSPLLYWLTEQDQAVTDQPVRIETDHMLLRGRGAKGFAHLRQMTVERDVELVLNPTDHDVPATGPKQVTITCEGPLSFDYGHDIAIFEQDVHVKDPNGDLYSDKLIAYLDKVTRTIRYAEAIGRVRIHQRQNTAHSERAIYEPALGKITLVGKPSLLVYPSTGHQPAEAAFGALTAVTPAERPSAASKE